MRTLLSLLVVTFALPATAAAAKDRPVTDQERPRLEAALEEAGCSGGRMEFDDDRGATHPDGKFEVDDATCQDGKKYDLAFDPSFKLLSRKLD